jgi:hypothetical protein
MVATFTETLLLTALLILGLIVLYMVGRSTRWFRQWRETPPDMEAKRIHFSFLMSERLGCALRSAEVDKAIIDDWNDCPMEYRPALYQVIRQAQILEETLIEEAMLEGIYPSRVVTRGQEIPPPPPMPRLPPDPNDAERTDSVLPPRQHHGDNVVTLPPRREWVSGQLLKYG